MKGDEELREKLKTAAEKVARQLEAHDRVYRDTFDQLKLLVEVWHEKYNHYPAAKGSPADLQSRSAEEIALWVKNNIS